MSRSIEGCARPGASASDARSGRAEDHFGYADAVGPSWEYKGLVLGAQTMIHVDSQAVLVQPEIARSRLQKPPEGKEKEKEREKGGGGGPPPPPPPPLPDAKRF